MADPQWLTRSVMTCDVIAHNVLTSNVMAHNVGPHMS